ncbi:TM2 domain-containing protein [Sporomusa aerivorans]|uniref:TM2 domain-containing protein n=1 Tax=Sporomusa aerivorans TaxID=204936 RepID=UPI00352A9E0B
MSNLLLKQGLTTQQLAIIQSELSKKAKSKTTAYIFWFFLGALGGHRYYVGDIVRGIFMTLTLGGLGIWALIDVFFIGSRVEDVNEKIEFEVIQTVSAPVMAASEVAATK